MENKKFEDLELYMLLRVQAQLVEHTKYDSLDKTFKTGKSSPDDISIFSLLGILLDLQNLNANIYYPKANTYIKVSDIDVITFIAKNSHKMTHTRKSISSNDAKTILNWVILTTNTYKSKFADFLDYLQSDLHFGLVLPQMPDTLKYQAKKKQKDLDI